MERGQALIRLLFIAILAIVITFGAIRLFSGLFSSSGEEEVVPTISVVDYADTDSVASLRIAGEARNEEDYREIRIAVTRSAATFEIIQGYEGNVLERKSYEQNQEGYEVFLRAIELEGFVESRERELHDDRGVCPSGKRYIFDFEVPNEGNISHLWGTSCNRREGTLAGNRGDLVTIFQQQIPDYRQLSRQVDLD